MAPTRSARRGCAVLRELGPPPRPAPPPLGRRRADGPRSRGRRGAAGPRPPPMREASGGSRAPLRRVPPLPFLGAEHRVQAPLAAEMVYGDFKALLFVPKRAPFDLFDSNTWNKALDRKKEPEELKDKLQMMSKDIIKEVLGEKFEKINCFKELPVLLDEQFCKEQIKLYVSNKAVENPPFPERQMKKICCADESYVCFARDDEDKLLTYGFETVQAYCKILKVINKCIELFFQIAENKEDYNNSTRPSPRT